MNTKNVKIYCIYYDNLQLQEYNIKETEIIKLFNTKENLPLDNINYLQKYFCELCAYYYIWKNQIKSDLIGFCHYRRFYHKIYTYWIDNNHTQAFYKTEKEIYNNYWLNEYAKEKYNLTDKSYQKTYKHCYIFTWDTFNKVCEFIFGFYDWLSNKIGYDWKNENNIKYFIKSLCGIDDPDNWPTSIAVFNEFSIAYYLSHISDVKSFYRNMKYIIVYHSENKDNLFKVYKKNLKTGCKNIYNISSLCGKNFTTDEYEDHRLWSIDEYDKQYLIGYLNYDYIFINIHLNLDDFLNDLKEYNIKPIILNDDEYIECEDFSNFKNYKIKKINE